MDDRSTFERLMNTPVAQDNKRVAALVIFERGVTLGHAQEQLEASEFLTVENVTIREFDPDLGGYPIIYFP